MTAGEQTGPAGHGRGRGHRIRPSNAQIVRRAADELGVRRVANGVEVRRVAVGAGGRPDRAVAPDADHGSATVWAAAAAGLLLLVAVVGVDLGSAIRARHVAESAADLSALAAAGRSTDGVAAACAVARSTAEAGSAALRDCRLEGWDAVVRVEVARPWTLLGRGPAQAAARAGPVPPGTEPDPTGAQR